MHPADFVIRHLRQLIPCEGPAPRRGTAQGVAPGIGDGALATHEGTIVFAGPTQGLAAAVAPLPGARVIDAPGYSLVPGFVDAHTHVMFAGDRGGELRRRLAGETYAQIAAAGGGIVATVRATRSASEDDLVDQTRQRLDEMLACGTTTVEIKSGYGLETASELKMLRAVRRLAATHVSAIVPTFLGAHEVPLEYRGRPDEYVRVIVDEMIPAVASERLAEWCDVFCETGVFTPAQSMRILEAGARAGLKPRIHADELAASGGSHVAAAVGARSADHLVFADAASIDALAAGGVAATLLPAAAFYLKLGRFAPARTMIDASVPVAVATDVNPGGGFSPSMPFIMTLACFAMGLTFEEALVAGTLNAAWAVDRDRTVGSLEPGKLADAVVVRGDAVNLIRVGAPSIAAVLKKGRIVSGALECRPS
jgi:imidazolonepropionase